MQGYFDRTSPNDGSGGAIPSGPAPFSHGPAPFVDEKVRTSLLGSREDGPTPFDYSTNMYVGRQDTNGYLHDIHQRPQAVFSPFSPDPNAQAAAAERRQSVSVSRSDGLPHPSRAFAPGFFPAQGQDSKLNANNESNGTLNRASPTSARPASASRYGAFIENSSSSYQGNRAPGRPDAPILRPSSGPTGRPDREVGPELDAIQDLNGTLASLDLDRPWKSPTAGNGQNPSFRLPLGDSPSP